MDKVLAIRRHLINNHIIGEDVGKLITDYAFQKCYVCEEQRLDIDLRVCWNRFYHQNMNCCLKCIKANNFKLCYICRRYNERNNLITPTTIDRIDDLINMCVECINESNGYYYCKALDVAWHC